MKSFYTCITLFLLFLYSSSKLTEEERNYFLQKLTYKISQENFLQEKDILNKLNINYLKEDNNESLSAINYDKTIIDEIIKKYNFPQNFNFLKENNIDPIVKNQQGCGCCWSHSSTTALSYRYKKALNIDVNLSPQDGLSCYLPNCAAGNSILDAQLNLIRNGSLTEQCFPFVSGDGKNMPACPSSCIKESTAEFIKYQAKNVYLTRDYYSEKTYYDIVALIMDQLVTYGPVVSQISDYEDFERPIPGGNCSDYIYKHNENSDYKGGHAVTIVGYGLKDNRYYWLIQNSWGTSYCDKGFIKVEFGQIGIEQVSFAEPYLPNKESTPDKVELTFDSLADDCKLNIKPPNFDFNNSFEVNFEKVNNNDDIKENPYIFKYICGKFKDQNDKDSLNCYFEDLKYPPIGKYQFKNLSTLGTENIFTDISGTFNGKSFDFFSWDLLYPLYNNTQVFFVSEKGSGIIFTYEYSGNDNITSYIYPSNSIEKNLKNCKIIKFSNVKFVYCELDNDEIEYFNYPNQASDNPIVYKSHCGKMNSHTIVYKINKNENPVFKIIRAYTKRSKTVNPNTEIKLVAKVEGSISGFNKMQEFVVFGEIVEEKTNDVVFLCKLTKPENTGIEHEIICTPNIKEGDFIFYNINIYPYVIPRDFDIPYEIFISENIKVKETFSKYLKNSILLILSLLTFL